MSPGARTTCKKSRGCTFFQKGTLTLQSLRSKRVGITGLLQTSRFNRSYTITAKEEFDTASGVRTVHCPRNFEDTEGFVGSMQLHGSKIVAWWSLPGLRSTASRSEGI